MELSVVIPVCHGAELDYLVSSVSTIASVGSSNFSIQVIIVDSSSDKARKHFIKEIAHSSLIHLQDKENRGVSFARNQGVKVARGEFIMFLDSDAYLDKNFWQELKRVIGCLPSQVGAISPKIINARSRRVFSCGLKISSFYRVFDVGRGKSVDEFTQPLYVDGPNTCCAIYRRSVLEEIKEDDYFDNDFFFLFEDADLVLRLKKSGYKCLFVPELVCYHYGGASRVQEDYRRFLCFRNRIFMVLKHNKGMRLFLFFLRSFFYDLIRTIHFALTNKYFTKAVKDILRYHKKLNTNNSKKHCEENNYF